MFTGVSRHKLGVDTSELSEAMMNYAKDVYEGVGDEKKCIAVGSAAPVKCDTQTTLCRCNLLRNPCTVFMVGILVVPPVTWGYVAQGQSNQSPLCRRGKYTSQSISVRCLCDMCQLDLYATARYCYKKSIAGHQPARRRPLGKGIRDVAILPI